MTGRASHCRAFAAAGFLALSLAACGSDGPVEGLTKMNPFAEEEQILAGDRKAALSGIDPTEQASGQSAAPGAAGGGADWPQAGGPPSNDSGNVAAALTGGRLFAVKAGQAEGGSFGLSTSSGRRISARPVASATTAYVYDPNGNVSAHALANGARVFRANVRPEGESTVVSGGGLVLDGGRVFAGTGFGEVIALDAASGARLWSARLDAPTRGAPSAGEGKIFAISQAGTVSAINQADGSVAWTAATGGRGAGLLGSASPAVAAGMVVVPTSSGEIIAFETAGGARKWTASVIGGSRQAAVTGLLDASASPVIREGVVYATGVGGRTIAVRLKDGETLWQQTIGGAHTPIVSGDSLFLIDLDDRLVAFDRSNGKVRWAIRLPKPEEGSARAAWAGPVLASGRLWQVSAQGAVLAVDAANGSAGTAGQLGVTSAVPPILAGGRLLVLGGDGTLVALN